MKYTTLLITALLSFNAIADGDVYFTWEPKLEFVGEPVTYFTVDEIEKFTIYGNGEQVDVIDGTATSFTRYYVGKGMTDFSITTTVDGLESERSDPVSVNLSAPPKKPINLTGNKPNQ